MGSFLGLLRKKFDFRSNNSFSISTFDKKMGLTLILALIAFDFVWTFLLLDLVPIRNSGEVFFFQLSENIRETGLPHYRLYNEVNDYYLRSLLFTYPMAFIGEFIGDGTMALRLLPVLFYSATAFLVYYVVGGLFGVAAAIMIIISNYQFGEIIAKPYTASEFQYLLVAVLFFKAYIERGPNAGRIARWGLPLAIIWGALTYEGTGLAMLLVVGLGIIYLGWGLLRQSTLLASMVFGVGWLYFSATIMSSTYYQGGREQILFSKIFNAFVDMVWGGKHVGAALNTLGNTFLAGLGREFLVFLAVLAGILCWHGAKNTEWSVARFVRKANWLVVILLLGGCFGLLIAVNGTLGLLIETLGLQFLPLGGMVFLITMALAAIVVLARDDPSAERRKLLFWVLVLAGSLMLCAAFALVNHSWASGSTRYMIHLFPVAVIVIWLSAAFIFRTLFEAKLPSRSLAFAIWGVGILGISFFTWTPPHKPIIIRGYVDYPSILDKWSKDLAPDDLVFLLDDYSPYIYAKRHIDMGRVVRIFQRNKKVTENWDNLTQQPTYNFKEIRSRKTLFNLIDDTLKTDRRVWVLGTAAADPIPQDLYDRYDFRLAREFYDLKKLPDGHPPTKRDRTVKTLVELDVDLNAAGPRTAEAVAWGWDGKKIGRKRIQLEPGRNISGLFWFPMPAKTDITLTDGNRQDTIRVGNPRYYVFGDARYPFFAATAGGRLLLDLSQPFFTGVKTFYPEPPAKPSYTSNNPKIIPLIYQVKP